LDPRYNVELHLFVYIVPLVVYSVFVPLLILPIEFPYYQDLTPIINDESPSPFLSFYL
jgi:hypothetical protein